MCADSRLSVSSFLGGRLNVTHDYRKLRLMSASAGRSIVALALFAACGVDATAPIRTDIRINAAWVAGIAARAVDSASGAFVFSPVVTRSVSQIAAESVAVAVTRMIGREPGYANVRESLQSIRKSPIDFARLVPCARATYARSPFPVLPAAAPGWTRRGRAPSWAVPVCAPGEAGAQLSFGVPDAARDIVISNNEVDQERVRKFGRGNDWTVAAIQTGPAYPTGLPLTPERATEFVFMETARRIVEVPEPFLQSDDRVVGQPMALCASWRMMLESPVSVRSAETGEDRFVSELFVRRAPTCTSKAIEMYIPTRVQPMFRWVVFPKDTTGFSVAQPEVLDSVSVPLAGPNRFEAVTVVKR